MLGQRNRPLFFSTIMTLRTINGWISLQDWVSIIYIHTKQVCNGFHIRSGLHKMNNPHPWQLKKWKSLRSFWSYQLNSTADWANLAQIEVNGLDWQCCLGSSSKMAHRIFIFSIVLGAKYSFMWNPLLPMPPHFWCMIVQS